MTAQKKFIIVLVDDHFEEMDEYMDEIDDFLDKKGFKLKTLKSKKGEKIINYLSDNDVDLLLTDKNLGNKTGKDIINEVRNHHFLTDILFYSGVSINENDYVDLGKNYFSVKVIKNRLIVPPLKKMITKHLEKWENVVFLRGLIISDTIELESKVNDFFMKYFQVSKKLTPHFDLILEGTAISLEGKKIALGQIITDVKKSINEKSSKYDSIVSDLEYAQQQRNILAHCKPHPTEKNQFISKGDSKIFDKNKMRTILNRIEAATNELNNLISEI